MSPTSSRPQSPAATIPREPIRRPGLWVVLALVVLAGVPLYLPQGAIEPVVLGLPLWLLGSVAAAVALSAVVCWACLRAWSLAEPAEEAELDRVRLDMTREEGR